MALREPSRRIPPQRGARRTGESSCTNCRSVGGDGGAGRGGESAMRTGHALLALTLATLVAAPLQAQRPRRSPRRTKPPPTVAVHRNVRPVIPTPRSILGFDPGDDRKLVEWPVLVRYYEALAKASDRVDYRELGKTTLGAPFIALVISSPANIGRLDYYRQLNAELADPRTLRTSHGAREAALNGKTGVLLNPSIQLTGVGGHLAPVALAYQLAAAISAATRTIT